MAPAISMTQIPATLLTALESLGVKYEKFDHPPLFTCEDSKKFGIEIPGADTKNLFLREEKGERVFLVSVPHSKSVDLKSLAKLLEVKRFAFGSPELMLQLLGVTPGAVTILGVVSDINKKIEVVIDSTIWGADSVQAHPMVNTSTLVISKTELERFLKETGHIPRIIEVPAKP